MDRVMHMSQVKILLKELCFFVQLPYNRIICSGCYINPSRLNITMKDQILSQSTFEHCCELFPNMSTISYMRNIHVYFFIDPNTTVRSQTFLDGLSSSKLDFSCMDTITDSMTSSHFMESGLIIAYLHVVGLSLSNNDLLSNLGI